MYGKEAACNARYAMLCYANAVRGQFIIISLKASPYMRMSNACNIMSRYSCIYRDDTERHQRTSASHSSAFDLQDGNLEANTYSSAATEKETQSSPIFRASGQCGELRVAKSNDLHAPSEKTWTFCLLPRPT
ncbi:hypothetical protein LB504_011157 [Fusarium proliferatum]|nr:hypothetical protein LB504_011157 [Fusarium proliferatum]